MPAGLQMTDKTDVSALRKFTILRFRVIKTVADRLNIIKDLKVFNRVHTTL